MRPLPEIDRDLAATASKLARLQIERAEARQAQVDGIVASFDAGLSATRIAATLGLSRPAVIGILWRAGRTEKTRANIRQRARFPAGSHSPEPASGASHTQSAAARPSVSPGGAGTLLPGR